MCDVCETRTIQSKSWIWKGILLKSEAAGLTKVAAKLEVDVPVDKQYLTLPAGAEIREFKMQRQENRDGTLEKCCHSHI